GDPHRLHGPVRAEVHGQVASLAGSPAHVGGEGGGVFEVARKLMLPIHGMVGVGAVVEVPESNQVDSTGSTGNVIRIIGIRPEGNLDTIADAVPVRVFLVGIGPRVARIDKYSRVGFHPIAQAVAIG